MDSPWLANALLRICYLCAITCSPCVHWHAIVALRAVMDAGGQRSAETGIPKKTTTPPETGLQDHGRRIGSQRTVFSWVVTAEACAVHAVLACRWTFDGKAGVGEGVVTRQNYGTAGLFVERTRLRSIVLRRQTRPRLDHIVLQRRPNKLRTARHSPSR